MKIKKKYYKKYSCYYLLTLILPSLFPQAKGSNDKNMFCDTQNKEKHLKKVLKLIKQFVHLRLIILENPVT